MNHAGRIAGRLHCIAWHTRRNPARLWNGRKWGSFGTWAQEHELNLVTYEFEAASPYDLKERHAPVLIDVLTGNIGPEGS